MNEAKLKEALDLAEQLRLERTRGSRDGADEDAKRRLLNRLLDTLARVEPPPPASGCPACKVEAEIGTEEVPHPVDARLHLCTSLDARTRRRMATQHLRAALALLAEREEIARVRIVVNTVAMEVEAATLSYAEIVRCAGMEPSTFPTVTYSYPDRRHGSLAPGDACVAVEDGMTFTVVHTRGA